jgi:hypothetical protein
MLKGMKFLWIRNNDIDYYYYYSKEDKYRKLTLIQSRNKMLIAVFFLSQIVSDVNIIPSTNERKYQLVRQMYLVGDKSFLF